MHRLGFAILAAALACGCSPSDRADDVASPDAGPPVMSEAAQPAAQSAFTELDSTPDAVATSAGMLDLAAIARAHDADGEQARVGHVYDFGDGVVLVDVHLFGGMQSSDFWVHRLTPDGDEVVLHQLAAEHDGLQPDLTWDFNAAGFATTPERLSYWTCRVTFDAATRRPLSAAMTDNPDGVDTELCGLD